MYVLIFIDDCCSCNAALFPHGVWCVFNVKRQSNRSIKVKTGCRSKQL